MIKITYFVHGTTIDNEKGLSTGWADGELSELGIKQAKELKNQIKNIDFDLMFCSDLKRAVDSANFGFAGFCTIIEDRRLRECNYGLKRMKIWLIIINTLIIDFQMANA